MSAARYWWRLADQRSWRQAVALALLTGLLGAVTLGAVAGARRTAGAYDRYLISIQASDVFVNVPGKLPAEPVLRPIRLIRQLPGIIASAPYLGLSAAPVLDLGQPLIAVHWCDIFSGACDPGATYSCAPIPPSKSAISPSRTRV